MTEPIWQLSQNHLNLLSTCPRKFQYTYLEKFTSPYIAQSQSHFTLGNRFHRLMQQRELGLSIESILAADEPLKQSFEALAKVAPNVVYGEANTGRYAEHRRVFRKEQFLFTGIYDLLILRESEAEIIDWKTYPQPSNQDAIENNWQTRLYLYLLTETSAYVPEQIKFTYWFIKVPQKPTAITFQYNQNKHERTKKELTELLKQLKQHYQDYQKQKKPFPQVEESKGFCVECPFTLPCGRNSETFSVSPEAVEEVII